MRCLYRRDTVGKDAGAWRTEILRPSWTAAVFLHERRARSSLLRRNEHGHEQQTEGKRGELAYAHWLRKRLLRRPCTGWHRRLLRARCGSQVDRWNRLWMWVSDSTRRVDEGGLLRLGRGRVRESATREILHEQPHSRALVATEVVDFGQHESGNGPIRPNASKTLPGRPPRYR